MNTIFLYLGVIKGVFASWFMKGFGGPSLYFDNIFDTLKKIKRTT